MTAARYSRKFRYCSGCSTLSPRSTAIAAWRSSRFLADTRSSVPWIAICTFSLLSLTLRTSLRARSASTPWRSAIDWRIVLPLAFSAGLKSSAAGSTLRRVRCTFSSSCNWRSFKSSSATRFSAPSSRFTWHLLPLKSKRVAISRSIPAIALSTSARSRRETISKLGIADFPLALTLGPFCRACDIVRKRRDLQPGGERSRGRGERVGGGNRRGPVEERASRRVIDLQRQGQPGQFRADPRQPDLARSRRMGRSERDQRDQILAANQAATVVERGERQRHPARRQPEQRPEIRPHSRSMDQGRADDDELYARNFGRRPLARQFGAAVGVLRSRIVVGAERPAGGGR